MKRFLAIIIALCIFPVSSACAYTSIAQDKAEELMEEAIIVDVRTMEEFNSGHISGAICIPVEGITTQPEQLPDFDQLILIYCRSGRRSKEAAEKLDLLGYKQVFEFGGIIDWDGAVVSAEYDNAESLLHEGKDEAAIELLEKAVKDGDTSAMILLGEYYLSLIPPAYEQAGQQFKRAGMNGNSIGYFKLAEMYQGGLLNVGNPCTDDLEKLSLEKAVEYYKLSADLGNKDSQSRLLELGLSDEC